VLDQELCTHCSVCTGQCPTGALSVDGDSMELLFSNDDCISCGICIPACPFGALSSTEASFGNGGT
jgi:ferredoxin